MGLLAENKRSSKISKDPNNTKWTKNANSFGQKIMRSQGWEPGQYLGAEDAAHAESYTAANASYIRVTLKDDMKGLGFHKAKEDQVTGLDVFSDLLSRLNGKSEEEVEDGKQARMAVKANLYVEQKWGPMRFVRGGLLVGDKLEDTNEGESSKDGSSSDEAAEEEEKPKKSKKRKAAEEEDEVEDEEDESARKKRRKEERRAKKASKKSSNKAEEMEEDEARSSKKSKKSKKNKTEDESDDTTPPAEETKAERKERKRAKKEKKRKQKEASESEGDATGSASASALPSGTSTPSGTGTSTPVPKSRNFVRSRFIAQKKEALLDAKALNQIFMVKA
ncbi:protein PXR1 [Sarocladium implicatum]|nr:protein PXR1 [Sarocladium implicatum]